MTRIADFDPADYTTRQGVQLALGQEVTVLVPVHGFGGFPQIVVRLVPRHIGDVACVCVRDDTGRHVMVNAVNVHADEPIR